MKAIETLILAEIAETKEFLKDDFGRLDMNIDPMQTASFTRGKQVGLNIALDIVRKHFISNTETIKS